jgi:F-type H+-transporting ATPase subunit gamma
LRKGSGVSHLVQLREQIKAVQTTKKITHAVRLVSMSMYSKLEKFTTPHKTYFESIANFFTALLERKTGWDHPVFNSDDVLDARPLFIIIATSKGLCGSLNSNLFRFLEQSIFPQPHQKAEFIVLGLRGIRYIKERSWGEVVYAYPELNSNNYTTIAEDIVNRIVNSNNNYSSVTFFGSRLQSFFQQQPKKMCLLPLRHDDLGLFEPDSAVVVDQEKLDEDTILEQKIEDLLEYTAASYTYAYVSNVLFQAILAEHAARFLAMDSSTTNAEKYLEKLTLQYNKIRQAVITKEVAELSSNTFLE